MSTIATTDGVRMLTKDGTQIYFNPVLIEARH